ncbi:Rev7p NDAI_0B03940 [Naumovozyma dairenensis CBS 421]|uniref:HORMA domain-containing protein n=1 Tax=Naumovozyma dairenensis (strain ATCC 10597 / BCRC 20456 / CBS 421 / NBRC 0211 / NRRL Y-12639) TaxID=1071378 RepID=G0W6L7_NAUDC|nr:hypothetical protein NDAI_0B03940 [Naumovozyma dairenensis CBS 421]CCD23428.1 hypothetical protein NDAI_0B03940 [Naumovozyma dairenensis CBS 421]
MNKWITKWLKIYLKSYINLILYYRNVYPSTTFDFTTYQTFNLPQFTPINRHPQLQSYIEELILDLLSKLNHIYHISLCIINKSNEICVEKYVLDFGEFKHITTTTNNARDDGDDDEDNQILSESEVFDEFRSSLNSLISHLEKLPKIKDNMVTFQIVINAVELQLGHHPHYSLNHESINNENELLQFDRDVNWVKCKEDENLPKYDYTTTRNNNNHELNQPRIKMSSLVGCDVGPMIIHQFSERLILRASLNGDDNEDEDEDVYLNNDVNNKDGFSSLDSFP